MIIGRCLRLKTVGDFLGKSRSTLYRLIHAGELTALKIEGSTRITEGSVLEYRWRQIKEWGMSNDEIQYTISAKEVDDEMITADKKGMAALNGRTIRH